MERGALCVERKKGTLDFDFGFLCVCAQIRVCVRKRGRVSRSKERPKCASLDFLIYLHVHVVV